MLERAGRVAPDDHAKASELAAQRGIGVIDALLELQLVGEDELVQFAASKLLIPVATPPLLSRLDQAVTQQIPGAMAWEHSVLPVSLDDVGNLTLAMTDPTDMRAIDAVTSHTGAYLVRAVAPARALRAAIARCHPDAAPRLPPAERPATPPPAELPQPLSPQAFAEVFPRLVTTHDRDEITEVLLGFLNDGFDRVIMFVHVRDQLRGRDCRGHDLVLDAVKQVRIPASGASTFAEVIESRSPYLGKWRTDAEIDRVFAQALGGIEGTVLVLPVLLRDKVPVVVFASGTRYPVDPDSLQQLVEATSNALERLIMGRKTQG